MQYYSLYSIGPCFYHQSHPQLGIVFHLAPSFHSFSTDLSSILGTYCPREFLFQYPIILPFHTVHGVLLEKEMATHSSVLAWRIPGMGEPSGLPSTGSHRVRHDWRDLAAAAAWGSQGKNTEEACRSLLQWAKFCQTSPP